MTPRLFRMQKIKIAQFGLGPIGLASLKLAAQQPWMEIVGAVDQDPAKAGRSLADFAGLEALRGIKVEAGLDELLQLARPDVVLHTASSSAVASLQQLRPALELGIATASTCEELIFPALRFAAAAREYDALCRRSGARVVATGVNPGFVMDVLPICLTGVSRSVDSILVERVVDASTRRQPLQAKIGSGQTVEEFAAKLNSGQAGHSGLRESLALVAHAMGWNLDSITEVGRPVVAAQDIRTIFFSVARGRTCGIHQHAVGLAGGIEKVVLDLKMYLDAPDPRDHIVVRGRPPLELTVNGGVAGDEATVAALINVVPRLLAAPAGLRLLTELALPAWAGNRT
jgi:4-hydroxy-tetrahydrodipicolinate reductase